jgi:tetratricopeptide (TPR) repeat protein
MVGPDDVAMTPRKVEEVEARVWLNELLLSMPEHRQQATADLEAMQQVLPDDPLVERGLGYAALQKNDFQGAMEHLQAALEGNARDPWTHYYLAVTKYRAGRASGRPFAGLANMQQSLKIVLDENPEFAEAFNLLGLARIEGGGTASALDAMRAAIRLNPRNEWYTLNLGEVYFGGRKWEEARGVLDRLKSSGNPQIAAIARQRLADLEVVKKYGVLPQAKAEAPKPALKTLEDEERRPEEAPPDTRPVQFAKGRIVLVDCAQAPAATVTVATATRTLKLRVEDTKSVILIGTDSFSCAWRNVPVLVNYKAGRGKADGDLVSVEVQ